MWGFYLGVFTFPFRCSRCFKSFRCSRRLSSFPCLCRNDSLLYYNNVDLSNSCATMDRDSSAREPQALEACQVVSDIVVAVERNQYLSLVECF